MAIKYTKPKWVVRKHGIDNLYLSPKGEWVKKKFAKKISDQDEAIAFGKRMLGDELFGLFPSSNPKIIKETKFDDLKRGDTIYWLHTGRLYEFNDIHYDDDFGVMFEIIIPQNDPYNTYPHELHEMVSFSEINFL